MNLFPIFVPLKKRRVLIIGGGKIATHRVKKILPFGPSITIVAKEVSPEMNLLAKKESLPLIRRCWENPDLDDQFMVIAAIDCLESQQHILDECKKRNILCNTIDKLEESEEFSRVVFPSFITRSNITIGISTGGMAPSVSAEIRKIIEAALPENIEQIIADVVNTRQQLNKGDERQQKIRAATQKIFAVVNGTCNEKEEL